MSATIAAAPAIGLLTARSRWERALIEYRSANELSVAESPQSPFCDRFVDEAYKAMDALIEHTDAPDLAALAVKVTLASGRAEGFTEPLFHDHARAIVADIVRLAAANASGPDPHPQWLADRNRLLQIANRWAPMADGLMDELTDVLSVLERRIEETPAATAQGWAAKAVLLLQLPSEGAEASEEQANAILGEAARLMGLSHEGNTGGPERLAA